MDQDTRRKTRTEKSVGQILRLAMRGSDQREAEAARVLMEALEEAGKKLRRTTRAA